MICHYCREKFKKGEIRVKKYYYSSGIDHAGYYHVHLHEWCVELYRAENHEKLYDEHPKKTEKRKLLEKVNKAKKEWLKTTEGRE